MLKQITAYIQNKKKYFFALLVVIFLSLLGLSVYYILNKQSESPSTVTPEIITSDSKDDILEFLKNNVTLTDVSTLPKDVKEFSQEKVYYVSMTGNDENRGTLDKPFKTITHALDIAEEGSTVFVREGKYRTNTLRISHSDFTFATFEDEEVILEAFDENLAFLLEGNINNVILDGFTIEDFETGLIYGDPQTQENIILKNLNINGATIGIENSYPTHTKYLIEGLLVKNVTMTDIRGIGLQCGDEREKCARNVLIQNVKVYGKEDNENNTGYDSCALVNSDNVVVVDSTFTYAPGDGLDFKSTRVSVVNTIVANPNRNGIKFWHEGEIINCIVYRTGADSAVVFYSDTKASEFRLINSIVAQHLLDIPASQRYAYAITIGYDEPDNYDIELINNIFYDMPGPIFTNSQSSIDIRNNIFYEFIHDNRFLVYGEDDFDNIEDLNRKEYASGNQYIDPKVSNPTLADWTLLLESPAINAGISGAGIPSFDINWKVRDEEIDIGPYENQDNGL